MFALFSVLKRLARSVGFKYEGLAFGHLVAARGGQTALLGGDEKILQINWYFGFDDEVSSNPNGVSGDTPFIVGVRPSIKCGSKIKEAEGNTDTLSPSRRTLSKAR